MKLNVLFELEVETLVTLWGRNFLRNVPLYHVASKHNTLKGTLGTKLFLIIINK